VRYLNSGREPMRAYVLNAPGPLRTEPLTLEELDDPTPGPGQVRVRVQACAACRTDLHVVEGDLPVRTPRIVPGHQVVGTLDMLGEGVTDLQLAQRVGVAWLHATCGRCRFCLKGAENLCDAAEFTGYTRPGGFATWMLARADFVYPLPGDLTDEQAAPLLCAGIIGYRCLQCTGLEGFAGARLGIYGFGAAGHIAIQLARARGAEVYVSTREGVHRELALALGARWVGHTLERPPVPLDAALVFAPAGEIVPAALAHLDKGGCLVLGGIHMSEIPALPYSLLYGERVLRSVANNTRADGRAFLAEAARIGVRTQVQVFPFEALPAALAALQAGVRGAAVVRVAAES
jgi:propanol-preferring alcohol dehydrogenase